MTAGGGGGRAASTRGLNWGRKRRRGASLAGESAAAVLVVALLFLTPILYAVWYAAPSAAVAQDRFPPTATPFPSIAQPTGPLRVVRVDSTVNASTRLTLLSLEGLTARTGSRLYLDFGDEQRDPASMLAFLRQRYGVATISETVDDALHLVSTVSGIAVVDPNHPESVNILTTYAGLHNAVLAGPDTAAHLSSRFGKPILWDYASSDWAALGPIAAQDRAFAEMYPQCNPAFLSILPPEQDMLRDYLITTRAFVFYDNQGMLASPQEYAQTLRFLHATPRGIPVLGWFRSPTLTEENAFVQMASSEGKFVIDAQDVPNLSVLTDFGRSTSFTQPAAPAPPATVQDKVYVVVAVADGDSLNFLANRMTEIWNDTARGSFPVAWSVNPLFADLAPSWVDYYYSRATPEDRFVAGPSGAGYLYPDYVGSEDLGPYLEFARRYMGRTGTDVAWLLNGFTSSEIPYSAATLSAYVDALHPRGLVLDYDDQPTTGAYWMQGGAAAAAPVIRSTQLWTTADNFLAKVDAALGARKPGPYFLWMTVYPWRFNLTQAKGILDILASRVGGALEIVSPEAFFGLMVRDFMNRGGSDLASMQADPIAPYVLNGFLTAAQGHLDAAALASGRGDLPGAAYESYQASQTLQDALVWEDAFFILVPLAAVFVAAFFLRARRRSLPRVKIAQGFCPLGVFAFVGLFVLDLQAVLRFNFWTYGYVVAGVVLAAYAKPLNGFLWRQTGHWSRAASAVLFVLASLLTLVTSAAFPLAALTGTAAVQRLVRDGPASPSTHATATLLGVAVGLALPVALGALLPLSVAGIFASAAIPGRTPIPAPARRIRGASLAAIGLILPMATLTAFLTFSVGLRLELQGARLQTLGLLIFASAALFAFGLSTSVRAEDSRGFAIRAFVVALLFSLGLLGVDASVTSSLMLVGASTAFALAAWALLSDYVRRGGDLGHTVYPTMALVPLVILFLRMPPVAYSLSVGLNLGGFPEVVEYALYSPSVLWAAAALALLAYLLLRRESHGPRGKAYWG